MIENLPEGILILDSNQRIVFVNQHICTLMNTTSKEIIGAQIKELIPEWDAKLIIEDEDSTSIECQTKIYGSLFRFRVSKILGEKEAFAGYIVNLQALIEEHSSQSDSDTSQREYHAIMDSLQDSYFEADAKGIITYTNHALVRGLGRTKKSDLIGRHFRVFTDRAFVREVFERFKVLYESKQPLEPFEFHYRRRDGEPLIGEAYISPIIMGNEVIGTRGFLRDITDRVNAEHSLREAKFELDERVKELNCLYGISELVETPGISLDEIFQGTVELIPSAWQYPEITCARITLGEREFATDNFSDNPLKQSADILVNGSKMGVVQVHYLQDSPGIDTGDSPFLDEERSLIRSIAERLGQITERQRQADRLATIYQVGLATTSSLDMDDILVTIYEQCRQVTNANVFFVALNDEENERISYPIFFDQGRRLEPFSLPQDTGLGGWIIRNQQPFICGDLEAEAAQIPIKMQRTGGAVTRSFVGVPLLGREGAIGALSIQSYQVNAYSEDDVQLLSTIAAQAAGAIQNAQLYEAEQAAKEKLEIQNLAIREQKDLLDGLLQHSPLAVVINDLEKRITVVNPAFEKMFGYSAEEAIGNDLDDILSIPEIVDEMRSISRITIQEKQKTYAEGRRKRKDGTLVDVELFTSPYFIGEQQFGYLVFYNDISERLTAETEREQTHASFRGVLDSLQDPYFEADKTGLITYANLGFVNTVGHASRDDVIGTHFRHFTIRSGIRDVYQNFKLVYETKRPAPPFEYRYRDADGVFRVGDAYISPIIEGNEVVGTRGVISRAVQF